MLTTQADPLASQALQWAIRVHDLSEARAFYGELLGCREDAPGRGASQALAFDLFGARLAAQLAEPLGGTRAALDVRLSLPQWRNLAQRLMAAGLRFEVPPHCQHEGHVDEHWTMVIRDPSGNALAIRASEAAMPHWH